MAQVTLLSYKILVLSWITAQRQLIHDRTASRTSWDTSYDFIIVGAGGSGAVLANKLAECRSVRVLLLEAGGAQNAIYNDIPGMIGGIYPLNINIWRYYNEPHDNYGQSFAGGRVPDQRGKTLGGSTAHNAMYYNRGNRRGYDEWANTYGAVGWSYRDLLPLFIGFENNTNPTIVRNEPQYHGTSGPIQVSSPKNPDKILEVQHKVVNELGYRDTDINGRTQAGYMLMENYITAQGLRSDTGTAYVDPNPYPDNLHIVCKALATKVLFNGLTAIGVEFIVNDISYTVYANREVIVSGAIGVEFIVNDISYTVYANREVIVSGGPINSPQLLMLSGVGPRQHLNSFGIPVVLDLPVGDNYHNHPNVELDVPLKPQYSYLVNEVPQFNVQQLSQLYYQNSGVQSQYPVSVLYYSTQLNRDKQWPNVELQSTDPLLPPLIDPNWLSDPEDQVNILDAVRMQFYLLERTQLAKYLQPMTSFADIGCPVCPGKYMYECSEGLKCYIRINSLSSYHPAGSCRMGAIERPDVVVDPQLRVKGANNLRVCDSSIFPVLPNGNTAAASIVVGYKCAQFIKEYYNLIN
ncbi:unnamed protein product [Medioppia subpectinata]|uniref:Glucose-methanol-choline oxidoreductase N-terminal domain-containing protein n=1 Tax=Medioppia subpectinata TaxID=1979941 RepID=A0A7R9PZQ1_9ACAR|nr:unnamed protein product [Medioppia subpectinata]CAG2107320.1 unnamed protein product [Medioppia subpectinata]